MTITKYGKSFTNRIRVKGTSGNLVAPLYVRLVEIVKNRRYLQADEPRN